MTGKLGVLNCTPDSMSSAIKGKIDYDLLYHKAQEYIKEGFEFLDIGGSSIFYSKFKENPPDPMLLK